MLKSIFTSCATNILVGLYVNRINVIELNLTIGIGLMFFTFQLQDIFRYVLLKKYSKIVAFSDLFIFLLFVILFILKHFSKMGENLFVVLSTISFLLGFLILIPKMLQLPYLSKTNFRTPKIAIGLLVSNILVFIFSSGTVAILQNSLLESELIDYRIVVLWLSPIGAFTRLIWVAHLDRHSNGDSKLPVSSNELRVPKIFGIIIFLELLTFNLFALDHQKIATNICLTLGLLTFALNTWIYPMLIQLRLGNRAVLICVVTGWNSLVQFAYVLAVEPRVDLIPLFFVGLASMFLLSIFLYKVSIKLPIKSL